jgi:hypothetical protein
MKQSLAGARMKEKKDDDPRRKVCRDFSSTIQYWVAHREGLSLSNLQFWRDAHVFSIR